MHTHCMVLCCCQIKHRYVVVSHIACVKTQCGSIQNDPELWNGLHQLNVHQEFIQSIANDQMFISGVMVAIPNKFGCTTTKK